MAEASTNDFGNTHRNAHRSKAGDFVMFADDDNWYTPDALASVRTAVQHDPDGLYIFQLIKEDSGELIPSPRNGEVEERNVDSGALSRAKTGTPPHVPRQAAQLARCRSSEVPLSIFGFSEFVIQGFRGFPNPTTPLIWDPSSFMLPIISCCNPCTPAGCVSLAEASLLSGRVWSGAHKVRSPGELGRWVRG